MAEATVESPRSTFFCHECMSEVQPNIPAFTCSRCNGGFIEEMARPVPPTQSSADSRNSDSIAPFPEMFGNNFFAPPRHRYNTRSAARNNDEVEMEDEDMRWVSPSAVFHFNTGGLPQPGQQTFHGIINYVIQRLSSDLGGGGRSPLILHGNPGDYAWGAGGLDAIISQLLNHLEGTGAPPAQREKIESLPIVTIEQSHIDNKLQCSICMDDFELKMDVKKLPCDHLYHSECIVKWLEMHGTCPVCRKDLNGEDTSTNEAEYPGLPPSANGGDGGYTSSASSSSSATFTEPSTSSSSFN